MVVENLVPCYFLLASTWGQADIPQLEENSLPSFPMENKGIWSYSPNVKYPHIPWNAHRNKFRPSEGWQLLPMRFFSSEKSRGCSSVSLEVFPWGFFLQPSQPLRTSPHARGCAEAPLCCTQTLLPSLFPQKNFSSGIEGKHRAQLSFPSAPQCQVPQQG